jgi:hypothetical protein
MRHLRTFAFSTGKRYQDLVPDADLVVPSKTHVTKGYEGWAYAARTADKQLFLAYFEQGCPRSLVRGARVMSVYSAQWFDPRDGTWRNLGDGTIRSNNIGEIALPQFPGEGDWGLKLVWSAPVPLPKHF